jgi:hypothetical protein
MKKMFIRFETLEGRFIGGYAVKGETVVDLTEDIHGIFYVTGTQGKVKVSVEFIDTPEDE